MTPRRGLIGLFIFLFLIAGVALATFTIDEQRDLSSRASTLRPTLPQTAIDEISLLPNESVWDGSKLGLLNVKFDHSLWLSPENTDTVFIHRQEHISVRLGLSNELTQARLSSVLGRDFIQKRQLGAVKTSVQGWRVVGFIFDFYGEEKQILFWQGPANTSALVVSPLNSSISDVENLLRGLVVPTNVKGATTLDDSAKLAALIRPSVVMIATSYCAGIKIGSLPGTNISDKSYPFCLAASGSGFFVNSDGYIATNGHVVKIADNSAVIAAVTTGQVDNLLIDFTQDYLKQSGVEIGREMVVQRVEETKSKKESLLQLAGAFIKLKESDLLKIENARGQYYVQAGTTPLAISQTGVNIGQDILEATLVDYDYQELDPVKGFSSSDVALIKVEGKNFPALPLGDLNMVVVGSSIQVFGFPGVVSGNKSLLLDVSAVAEPTVTRGIVSAIKKAKGDQRNLLQTDATVNHGNSGGPGVDSQGKVIGIATYGLIPEEGSGNYNFLRDVADLKALMEKNNVANVTGDTYKYWKQGLESFWLSYFQYAESDLQKVKEIYPIHPTVDKYLGEIKGQVGTPEDITPLIPRTQRRLYMSISGIAMALSLLFTIILLVVDKVAPKRPPVFPTTPPAPSTV